MNHMPEQSTDFYQVVAVDVRFSIFERAWCDAELVQAYNRSMRQELKIYSQRCIIKHRSKLQRLDVRQCQASREEDKVEILGKISDIDDFNTMLRNMLLNNDSG